MSVCLHRFCLNMKVWCDIVCSELRLGTTGFSGESCFGMIYVECYGV